MQTPVSEEFVLLSVFELNKNNLLDKTNDPEFDLAKLSRRELVRRVGVASMAALPLITSVIAPTAASAQSSCLQSGSNTGCVSTGDQSTCDALATSLCCGGIAAIGTANPQFCANPSTVPCLCGDNQGCIGTNGIVPNTASPNTIQSDANSCQTYCAAQTPNSASSCCVMSGTFTWSWDSTGSSVCECFGFQCN